MTPAQITIIQKCVAGYYGISLKAMIGTQHAREISRPRMLAMFLCKELTLHSYPAIGRAFSRDHTTVMHAVQTVRALFEQHPELATVKRDIVASILAYPQSDAGNRDAIFLPVSPPKHEDANAG